MMRGDGYGILLIFLILLQIIISSEGTFETRLLNVVRKNRVKRSWIYPPIRIRETIEGDPPFQTKKLLDITNNNANVMSYELEGQDPNKFSIEFNSAVPSDPAFIWQLVALDREEFSTYLFYAVVRDAAGNELDRVKLDVIVEDRNDNSPIFNVATLQGSVREDASPGTPVTTVVATDRDDPTGLDQYGFVSYKLATSPEDPPAPGGQRRFAISESGVITVVGNLDVETAPSVKVVIQAKDGMVNSPGNQVTATATIQISDANNRAPVFEGRPYNAKQGELLPLRSTVYSISASDADIDPANKAVTFTITAGDTGGVFDIHSNFQGGVTQGDITLEKPLDYEKGPKQFILTVNAKNALATNSDDTLYQASTTVIIDVLDENEPPVFINQPYNGAVTENQGPEPNIARVRAQDYDFGGNQTVTYAIVSTEGWFSINEEGSISSIAPVDREHPAVNQTSSIYTLVVSSTDNYRVKATSTANVAIRINDKNDNAPEPDGPWTVTICEVPPEPRVTTINIKDKDEPKNGPPFTVTIDDASGLWVLENVAENPMARSVATLTKSFDVNQQSKYELPIIMSDGPSPPEPRLTSTATLTINICRCNDKGELNCETMVPIAGAGFPVALLIAIIAAILILLSKCMLGRLKY